MGRACLTGGTGHSHRGLLTGARLENIVTVTSSDALVDIAERAHEVVRLRGQGRSFREIEAIMGVPRSTLHRRYRSAISALPPVKDLASHRAEQLADIEIALEVLRPLVHDDVFHKDAHAAFARMLERKERVLGLDRLPATPAGSKGPVRVDDAPVAREFLMSWPAGHDRRGP